MIRTTYVLISFGENPELHSQANFCFLTLKKFAAENSNFVIYTDQPKFYKWVSAFVEIRTISAEQIKNWIGKYEYFYRVKLKALLHAADADSGHLVYLDSDTIATKSFMEMLQKIDAGKCFMHLKENLLSTDTASDKLDMWNRVKNKSYENISVNSETHMWNSGVVAISEKDKHSLLRKSLAINDKLCEEGVECRVKEQFALGIVLESTGQLLHASPWIIHYWGNKPEWNHRINNYFSKIAQCQVTPAEAVEGLMIEDWINVPINRMKTSMGKRLYRWADKYFKDKIINAY
jgi:lipopolysaccharide biosynthesis glycosyltransferase